MTRGKPLPLQLKLTAALVVLVLAPLTISAYLIDQVGTAAANVAAGEAASQLPALKDAEAAYQDLADVSKRLYGEIAERLAQRPDFLALSPKADLEEVLNAEAGLRAIELVRADGTIAAQAEEPTAGAIWHDKIVEHPLGTSGALLRLTFQFRSATNEQRLQLQDSLNTAKQFTQVRTALPESYRDAYLALLSVAGLVAAGIGIWASSFVTRRITALVATARRISDGQLAARVALRGKDELAELGRAFNTMLDDLDQTRAQLQYLQRMSVWQDVARRLAHEIKNPLTPIKLAVQQCVSAYKGDDPKFKRLLVDTGEIVEEEIEGLRRLVDTFRTLGALPKVEAAPIALADVIHELKLDPEIATRLSLEPPATPVTVRADKLLLKRVLANLVDNAIDAGRDAGNTGDVVIGWSTDPNRDVATITIDDHGGGVIEANRTSIFEPYVTTKATGTGLGLAIARKIAIEHGGDVVLAPERAPTGGARFVVSLPLGGPTASPA